MISRTLLTEILNQTKDSSLVWLNVEGQTCCQATFNGTVYICCKYELEDGSHEVSFNKCDQFGHIISPFREYDSNSPFFDLLSEIYDIAWAKKQVLA